MTGIGPMTPLRRLAWSKRMTRTQLIEAAGLSRQTLYNIEDGKAISEDTILKLADVLDLSPLEVAAALAGAEQEAAA